MEYNSNCLHQDLNILTSAVHVCLLGRNSILAFWRQLEAHHAVKRGGYTPPLRYAGFRPFFRVFGTPNPGTRYANESANGTRTPNFVFCKKKYLKLEVKNYTTAV